MSIRSKSQNKAIKGRRNRCHAAMTYPVGIIKTHNLSSEESRKFGIALLDSMNNGKRMVITTQPPTEVSFQKPIRLKQPRFLS